MEHGANEWINNAPARGELLRQQDFRTRGRNVT
jgi:hypothetical protein